MDSTHRASLEVSRRTSVLQKVMSSSDRPFLYYLEILLPQHLVALGTSVPWVCSLFWQNKDTSRQRIRSFFHINDHKALVGEDREKKGQGQPSGERTCISLVSRLEEGLEHPSLHLLVPLLCYEGQGCPEFEPDCRLTLQPFPQQLRGEYSAKLKACCDVAFTPSVLQRWWECTCVLEGPAVGLETVAASGNISLDIAKIQCHFFSFLWRKRSAFSWLNAQMDNMWRNLQALQRYFYKCLVAPCIQ